MNSTLWIAQENALTVSFMDIDGVTRKPLCDIPAPNP